MNAVVNNTNMYECKYEYFNINNNTFCDRASIPIKHQCFVFFAFVADLYRLLLFTSMFVSDYKLRCAYML